MDLKDIKASRTIDRGDPITELVRGSMEYTIRQIKKAFYRFVRPWELDNGSELWVVDTFEGYIVVEDAVNLPDGLFYRVEYSRDGEGYAFDPPEDWEIVELAYNPLAPTTAMTEEAPAAQDDPEDQDPPADNLEATEARKAEAEIKAEAKAETPAAAMTEKAPERGDGEKIRDLIPDAPIRLQEAVNGGPRTIRATVAQADIVNLNRRRYPLAVLREAVDQARSHLHESMSQGRAMLLGEAEHPSDKRQRARFLETIVVWTELQMDANGLVEAEGEIVETGPGRDAVILMEAGVMPGVSLRGYGESHKVEDPDGTQVEEIDWIRFTGIDLVLEPGFREAAVTVLESRQQVDHLEDSTMDPKEKEAKATAQTEPTPDNSAQIEAEVQRRRELDEARAAAEAASKQVAALREALGLGEDADLAEAVKAERMTAQEAAARLEKIAAEKTAAETAAALEETVKAANMGNLTDAYREALGNPQTPEELEEAKAKADQIFNKIMADARLKTMGFNGVEVVGPVIETEAGIPAYARASFELTEGLIARDKATRRDLDKTKAGRFTREYLKRYDEVYKAQLAQEARQYEEAELTTDLNLPYSVLRSVSLEAFPQLVALSIFDAGVVNQSPIRIWYQAEYAGETGESGTVTDESFTSAHDAWVDLANARLDFGSVVVTTDPAGTTYTEGTDYVIDYQEGRIKVLSGGTMADATGFLADYTYKAIRKGEFQGIERAKAQLTYQTLDTAADRLATQISHEAIVFSRSQLGWDAVGQTLQLLIREVMRKIDSDLFADALSAALSVAGNSAGTWDSGTDAIADLFTYIGQAKVNIGNRYYDPTFALMSLTNAERVSNSDVFSANGARVDAGMNEAGEVFRMKGLPVFASTQFPDSYVLVGNRELVMYRVFQPMALRGPFPTYDANRELVAAEQYYIEEYNGHLSPLPGKGSYVIVT